MSVPNLSTNGALPAVTGKLRGQSQMQPNHFEKLLRGQQRLEAGLADVRKAIERLAACMPQGSGASAWERSTLTSTTASEGGRDLVSCLMVAQPSSMTQPGMGIVREASLPSLPPPTAAVASGEAQLRTLSPSKSASVGPHRTCVSISAVDSAVGPSAEEPWLRTPTKQTLQRPSVSTEYGSTKSVTSALAASRSAVVSSLTFRVHEVLSEVQQGLVSEELEEWGRVLRNANVRDSRSGSNGEDSLQVGRLTVGAGLQSYDGSWFILHPLSNFITFLDVLRMLFMMIDMALVPYMLALEVELTGSLLVLGWLVVSFWTCDFLINMRTGFISGGRVVTKWSAILLRYLRRGLFFDVAVLSVDYVDVLTAATSRSSSGVPQGLRFFKSLRLIRIVVRLRAGLLARLKTSLFHSLQRRGLGRCTQSMELTIIMLKVFVLIALLSHMGSCIWSAVELRSSEAEKDAWEEYDTGSMKAYPRALYWTVTTMFAGSSPVLPHTAGAGVLAVTWIVVGAVFVTSVTSTLAASIIEQHQKQQEMNKKGQILTSFLSQCNTPTLLSVAVLDDFNKKVLEPKPVTESDMPFLDIVKPTLRAALREQRYGNAFNKNDLLRMLCVMKEPLLQQLCFTASTVHSFPIGTEVFGDGDEMEHSLLLTSGTAEYTFLRNTGVATSRRDSGHSEQDNEAEALVEQVSADQWICEFAIIIHWTALGTLLTRAQSEFLLLSADEVLKALMNYPRAMVVTAQYAAVLGDSLTELCRYPVAVGQKPFFTDLDPGVDYDEIISKMPHVLRGLVSLPVLDMLRRHARVLGGVLAARKAFADLEAEVKEGKCHLSMGVEGVSGIGRVVRIVVLELTNQEGLMCVQMAECHGRGVCVPKFGLPGRKVRGSERPDEAAQEIINQQLHSFAHALSDVAGVEIVTESSYSASYGMRTKYIKTIFKFKLMGHLVRRRSEQETASNMMRPIDSLTSASQVSVAQDHPARIAQLPSELQSPKSAAAPQRRSLFPTPALHLLGRRLPAAARDQSSTRSSNLMQSPDAGDDLVSLACGGQTLDEDGSHHAFAVRARALGGAAPAAEDDGWHSDTPPELEAGEEAARTRLFSKNLYLYRWLSKNQYDALLQRRSEVELTLQSTIRHLKMEQWRKVLSWQFTETDKNNSVMEWAPDDDCRGSQNSSSSYQLLLEM